MLHDRESRALDMIEEKVFYMPFFSTGRHKFVFMYENG